ncbi:hypothetical protein ILYODFUR_012944 [Ilyodon furcidens]|uniref:Uncharacterized protein n=1 Tax=Ilyodon furcidens TaxID=33524 RepID=A0ABV0VDV5_9TELE
MSVCQQRDISALSLQPASQRSPDGRDQTIGKVEVLYGQWHHGKSATTPRFPNVLENCSMTACLPHLSNSPARQTSSSAI